MRGRHPDFFSGDLLTNQPGYKEANHPKYGRVLEGPDGALLDPETLNIVKEAPSKYLLAAREWFKRSRQGEPLPDDSQLAGMAAFLRRQAERKKPAKRAAHRN
ncbi:MAG: hypothetical protein HY978_00720 [Candidatus Liptonbacteria bacterium]|nr:hypothetical protein [Candidatus Liptonbacteria bacterium]